MTKRERKYILKKKRKTLLFIDGKLCVPIDNYGTLMVLDSHPFIEQIIK